MEKSIMEKYRLFFDIFYKIVIYHLISVQANKLLRKFLEKYQK